MKNKSLSKTVKTWKHLEKLGYQLDGRGELVSKKIYTAAYGPVPPGWLIFHVDGDPKHISPDNLIALPDKLFFQLYKAFKRALRNNTVPYTREHIRYMLKQYLIGARKGYKSFILSPIPLQSPAAQVPPEEAEVLIQQGWVKRRA